ncbi:MarR family transcriptional regulator [Sulfolobales archaeon HS-7]|nr:MarR family transcriptional regulator [Sulfolobales archaeon HS-7]
MDDDIVYTNGVYKWYGELLANENVTIRLKKGEIVSLLGPNGAGKTTLVKQIYGEIRPSKGEIRVLGNKPTDRRIKKRMGVIPQDCHPYGDLTVFDNVYYMGRLKGLSKHEAEKNTNQLLKKLDLEDRRGIIARELSGGLMRRVLIAMALVNEPEFIVLDEPTVGLDPEARREVWELLLELKREGRTMLLTTHYLDEAERLADRIYFINKRVILSGTPSEIKGRFSTIYEVIDYSTGTVHYVEEEKIKEFVQSLKGKFEVKLPSLEDIYLKVVKNDS